MVEETIEAHDAPNIFYGSNVALWEAFTAFPVSGPGFNSCLITLLMISDSLLEKSLLRSKVYIPLA